MVNIKKISNQILNDGLYNTLLFEMKEKLQNDKPTCEMIEELLKKNSAYIAEYKEINRHSELTSVQVKELKIDKNEEQEINKLKQNINQNVQKLKNLENFEVDSKNSAYSIWIGSVGVMVIFMAHNIVALFTELYTTHGGLVYTLFAIVLLLTYLGYKKIKDNHEKQHLIYKKIYHETKKMMDKGLKANYFTYDELYEV